MSTGPLPNPAPTSPGLSSPESVAAEPLTTMAPDRPARDGLLFTQRGKLHPLCALGALLLAPPSLAGVVAGVLLLLAWATLRLWAIRHIGGAARVRARKARERKRLVTSGPFALVRNPLYVANIMGLTGTCLVLSPVWYAALAGLAAFAWYAAIVRWEEGVLVELYGAEYEDYREHTPWLVPSLGRVLRGGYGAAALPWSKALRRERGLGVIVVVVALLAVGKWWFQ